MKRLAVLLSAFLLVATGYAMSSQPWRSADAQESRIVPVTVIDTNTVGSYQLGDICNVYVNVGGVVNTRRQIVVKNEDEKIIAMQNFEGKAQEYAGQLSCVSNVDMALPEAEFYTLYLEDTRIAGYASSSFPLNPAEILQIVID